MVWRGYLEGRRQPARKIKPLTPAKMEMPLCVMLSAITYTAAVEPADREAAFQQGARKCNRYMLKQSILLPEEDITFEALEAALDLFIKFTVAAEESDFRRRAGSRVGRWGKWIKAN